MTIKKEGDKLVKLTFGTVSGIVVAVMSIIPAIAIFSIIYGYYAQQMSVKCSLISNCTEDDKKNLDKSSIIAYNVGLPTLMVTISVSIIMTIIAIVGMTFHSVKKI